MLQSLRNRRNRKGFTLAELLIVLAIIAVMVAIAVPLFVGALDDAKKQVYEADKRSLKSVAVAQILLDDKIYAMKTDGQAGWLVTGTVSATGDVAITAFAGAADDTDETDYSSSYNHGDAIKVFVKPTDLYKVPGTSESGPGAG